MNPPNPPVMSCVTGCALMVLLHGCGSRSAEPASAPPKAAVTITLDGTDHLCNVALATETQGSSIACADVAAFVRDELRVPRDARYELRTAVHSNQTDMAAVEDSLRNAGYRRVAQP